MSYRKRKHRQRPDTYSNHYDQQQASSSTTAVRPDPSLFIVAHEADIIRGPQAARTADSLEFGINVDGRGGSRVGDGLMRWDSGVGVGASGAGRGSDVWVDRYDARLLLDARFPNTTTLTIDASSSSPVLTRSDSPGGWSDLPSDSEDTFFLTPEETADLHRAKRLRHLDALRTARLRALSPDGSSSANPAGTGAGTGAGADADAWGDSDEEPDESQIELMRRTASHVARATNDAQLRARILAHHGADLRFAFLRGRWGRAWARVQADAHREVVVEREAQRAGALGGLTGYGSGSEGESEDEAEAKGGGGDGVAVDVQAQVLEGSPDDQAAQEAQPEELALRAAQEVRRAKARVWAEKRRAAKAIAVAIADSKSEGSEE
ncbi:hypothetical protein F5148DRAFT_1356197 [Russula earlei]|uniref:Uncharacterized protein n=1 Tax=Russula earlei TaxID=71964 RepID=A0ACC0TTC4_9AGAM|nr:hypothetical protein F5148DRAFT_1356197 [Russula earlei]